MRLVCPDNDNDCVSLRIDIERTVRVSWPASATVMWRLEGSPATQGPWLRVEDPALPGVQQMTLPANEPMKFFRLVPAR